MKVFNYVARNEDLYGSEGMAPRILVMTPVFLTEMVYGFYSDPLGKIRNITSD
jgi:hypothetical protein